ncbi:hypothetical protein [Hyphococcus aureus]|uniref:Uncharacterized protein n=2 Tax=Hyphococcus aureus TaxID=2666033 RepID=A0ABW1KX12_9PROT
MGGEAMFGVRILSALTAYAVVLLEVYSGVIKGPLWWVLPGALVLALLTAVSLVDPANRDLAPKPTSVFGTLMQWIVILGMALAVAWFSNYFGRELVPELVKNPLPQL